MGFKAITPAIIRALNTQYSGIYQSAYDAAVPMYPQLTTFAPSSSKDNTYGWMAKLPKMREWIGERTVHRLAGHGFQIVNKKFELTLAVDRDDYDDDNLGQYTPVTQAIGEEARKHPDTLLFDLMKDGHLATATCFDGQNFFDTDHPEDSFDPANATTYSNYRTSMTLSDTNLFAMRAAMAGFAGENGRPFGVVPDVLVVPPALEKVALETVVAATVSTGGTNVGSSLGMRVLVVPELGGTTTLDKTWYLLDTRRAIKPFVYQLRRPTVFVQKFAETDQNVVMMDEYLWAASGRYNVGYGPWFLALKAVGS
jgi:phage major head subunit gpT-like protein